MADLPARLLRVLKKPPSYVLERAYNELRMRAERYRLPARARRITASYLASDYGYKDVSDLWNALASRRYPAALSVTETDCREICPGDTERILAAADRASRHRVDLLGSGEIELGDSIDWQRDYKTGYRWPYGYCGDLEYGKPHQRSDVKFPWELSRLQWLIPVGQAYILTRDERHSRTVKTILESWMLDNPCGGSINWSCTMEVALRIVTLTWFFHVFKTSPEWRDVGFRDRLLRTIYLHGDFTARHLEKSDINGNHYTADAAGLVFAGLFFGRGKAPEEWLSLGWKILCDELPKQVYDDGCDFEGSVAYHRLVQELFLLPAIYRALHGLSVPEFYRERLIGMARFTGAYSRSDGSSPLLGDADDARVLPFGGQPINDHRYLLALVGMSLNAPEITGQFAGSRSEVLWSLGAVRAKELCGITERPTKPRSAAFPSAGYFVMRNESDHVFVSGGRLGLGGRGGHSHNDSLSLEVTLSGVHLVSDCGAYVYTGNYAERNAFRSTAYHNTPQIDGEEINRYVDPKLLWLLRNDAQPDVRTHSFSDDVDKLVVSHGGYRRLALPVNPVRTVALSHRDHSLTITDQFEGTGEHIVDIPLHLAPGIEIRENGKDRAVLSGSGREFQLAWSEGHDWKLHVEAARVSPSYGVVVPTRKLRWTRTGPLAPLTVRIQAG